MDYSRMLFALRARELTMERLVRAQPDNLPDEARRQWRIEHFPAELAETVQELRTIADMIDRVE
jgi:hypothetical protein